jgi:hypothetical protein
VSESSEDITGTTPHMKFASSLTHDPKIDNYDPERMLKSNRDRVIQSWKEKILRTIDIAICVGYNRYSEGSSRRLNLAGYLLHRLWNLSTIRSQN